MTIFLWCLIGWFVSSALFAYRDGQYAFAMMNSALAITAGLLLCFGG